MRGRRGPRREEQKPILIGGKKFGIKVFYGGSNSILTSNTPVDDHPVYCERGDIARGNSVMLSNVVKMEIKS